MHSQEQPRSNKLQYVVVWFHTAYALMLNVPLHLIISFLHTCQTGRDGTGRDRNRSQMRTGVRAYKHRTRHTDHSHLKCVKENTFPV